MKLNTADNLCKIALIASYLSICYSILFIVILIWFFNPMLVALLTVNLIIFSLISTALSLIVERLKQLDSMVNKLDNALIAKTREKNGAMEKMVP